MTTPDPDDPVDIREFDIIGWFNGQLIGISFKCKDEEDE